MTAQNDGLFFVEKAAQMAKKKLAFIWNFNNFSTNMRLHAQIPMTTKVSGPF